MTFDDFRVTFRSDDEIERMATALRKLLDDEGRPDAKPLILLQRLRERVPQLSDLDIVVQDDAEMGRLEAKAVPKPPRLFLSGSTYSSAQQGLPRSRMTIAHEIAHLYLGHHAPAARMIGGNVTPDYIRPGESAERQARVFAAAFLMPRDDVLSITSPERLARLFAVSLDAARVRIETLARTRARPELDFVRDHINELRATAKSTHNENSEERERAFRLRMHDVWERSAIAEHYDPAQYRLCRKGYLVEKSQFLKRSHLGWREVNGQILSYESERES